MRIRVRVPLTLGVFALLFTPSLVSAQKLLADAGQDLASQIAASVVKEQKRKIAVVPFIELDGRATVLGTFLAEDVTTRLFATGGFDILERTLLNKVMAELKLGASGLVAPDEAKQIGKLAGVDAIVTGTVTDFPSSVAVNCRLIDAQTGRVFGVAQTRIVKDDDVRAVLGKALGRTGSSSSPDDTPSAPAPHRADDQMQTSVHGFLFSLPPCQRAGPQVSCAFKVENGAEDRGFTCYEERTKAVDANGKEYAPASFRLGDKGVGLADARVFYNGTALDGRLLFENVSRDVRQFSILEIQCENQPRGTYWGVVGGTNTFGVTFRNVTIRAASR
jgi:curli biogenesis system outer membrane secretion channel CsgG